MIGNRRPGRRTADRARATLAAGVLTLAALQCAPIGADGGSSPGADLAAARERWAAAGIEDYAMAVHRVCFCPEDVRGPAVVTVEDGRVVSRAYAGSGDPVPPRYAEFFPTVEAMFDAVSAALDAGVARVDAEYDPADGHPVRVYVDVDERMADEEWGWNVERFEPAP